MSAAQALLSGALVNTVSLQALHDLCSPNLDPRLASISRKRAIDALSGYACWICEDRGELTGIACVDSDCFETSVIGSACGKISLFLATDRETAGALLDGLSKHAGAHKRLSVRVDSDAIHSVQALEAAGFRTVDGLLTYGKEVKDVRKPRGVRVCQKSDAFGIGALAEASFVQGRYHADPWITSDQADDLYRQWGENAALGRIGGTTLVLDGEEGIAGFVLCSAHRTEQDSVGSIDLIAVDKAARGTGVGKRLVRAAMLWFFAQQCGYATVGTQSANVAASRFYQASGFSLVSSSVTLARGA
ncbi:MAG: GNAT family N-acetyltransferase [Armatimonadetes bacterium]|nr:GNAT family N-acetyltransferase [Armatimonadota bacterium]